MRKLHNPWECPAHGLRSQPLPSGLPMPGLQALKDVSLKVEQDTILEIVGPNGAGKTTLLRTLMGLHREFQGTILLDGEDIGRLPAWERSGRGLAMVPEGRRVFPDLTVEENLAIGAYSRTDRQRIENSMKEV